MSSASSVDARLKEAPLVEASGSPWLVSRRFDLAMFLVPALIALALVPLGPYVAPTGDTPFPMWIVAVLFVDVAHVWSTIYRTYLDREELSRRPLLYAGAPIVSYAFGVALASISYAVFWTGLAYIAVFHFVRQQYGWVALYNRRDDSAGSWDRRIDTAAIYASTLFPLLWWHAHLDREFHWFLPGDFVEGVVAPALVDLAWLVYVLALGAFFARQLVRFLRDGVVRTGKIIVVATTAACWGVGIIATNTDWAFTVTNVLIHGVPYFGIVWVYGRRATHRPGSLLARVFTRGWIPFYFLVVALAYFEELGWDRMLWHSEQPIFFGPTVDLSDAAIVFVLPLLALPQLVHYLLDGFIWRRRATPDRGERRSADGRDEDRSGFD